MNTTEIQTTLFPKGENASPDYFTGSTWLKMLVQNDPVINCTVGNVTFEPGARTNWHQHPGGQILLITDGKGYYQEKGQPIQVIQKGAVVRILPGVEHWHGATPENALTHLAINPNLQNGMVEWLQRVTDEEYNGLI